jgi:hypothetical protein
MILTLCFIVSSTWVLLGSERADWTISFTPGILVRSHSALEGERGSMQATSRLGHVFITWPTLLLVML